MDLISKGKKSTRSLNKDTENESFHNLNIYVQKSTYCKFQKVNTDLIEGVMNMFFALNDLLTLHSLSVLFTLFSFPVFFSLSSCEVAPWLCLTWETADTHPSLSTSSPHLTSPHLSLYAWQPPPKARSQMGGGRHTRLRMEQSHTWFNASSALKSQR